jgi:phage protein D
VNKLILSYAQYGLVPNVLPPPVIDPPIPVERTPVQQGTDLEFIEQLAQRHGYVFFVEPGPAPHANRAYFGPPPRLGIPQRAITVNMGAETNASLGAFQTNALAPATVEGSVQDRTTNQAMPVRTLAPIRPPLSTQPAWLVNQPNVRTTQLRASGLNVTQAFARAQGTTNHASDAVTVDGELDAARYGDMLRARGLVGVRGAGYQHDGLWYVKRVTHEIRPGSYKQSFSLARDGHGSTTPVVVP